MTHAFTSITLRSLLAIGATLSITAAFAGDNATEDQILAALQPKPLTRGLSFAPPTDPAAKAAEGRLIDSLRNRKTRSLSSSEREEIAEAAATKPNIDLEIQFDYNSADISTASMPSGPTTRQPFSLRVTTPSFTSLRSCASAVSKSEV